MALVRILDPTAATCLSCPCLCYHVPLHRASLVKFVTLAQQASRRTCRANSGIVACAEGEEGGDVEQGGGGGGTSQEARDLIAAAAQASQQDSTLQKLRQHFQRVVPPALTHAQLPCAAPLSPHTLSATHL